MFGRIPDVKILSSSDLLTVFKSTANDGVGYLGITSKKSGYILSIDNVNSLYPKGYLKKFVKCAKVAVRAGVFTKQSGYTPNHWLSLDFNEERSGHIVRSILDDRELSDRTKFAAIVSILAIRPEVSSDRLMSVIRNQTRPEDIVAMPFWRNLWFILPDFATADASNNRVDQAIKWSRDGFFDIFLNRSSFLSHSEPNETYSEYLNRTGENYFKPSTEQNSDTLDFLYEYTIEGSLQRELEVDAAVKDIRSKDAVRFYQYFTKAPSEFWPLILNRLKYNMLDAEIRSYGRLGSKGDVSYYLSMGELRSLVDSLRSSKNSEYWKSIHELGRYGAPLVAQFYLKGGASAVEELISYCERNNQHGALLYSNRSVIYSSGNAPKKELLDSFLKVFEPQYKDMPMDWALHLNVLETHDQIEEDSYEDVIF